MINISNNKIKSLKPEWADFKGFSLLFDNPAPLLNLAKEEEHLYKLQAGINIPFYQAIQETLENLGTKHLLSNFSLCLLPLSSYHVTYLDGLNDKNKIHLKQDLKTSFQAFEQELPQSLREKNSFTHFQEKPLQNISIDPVVFEYQKLENWKNKVLSIVLKPSSSSQDAYRKLLLQRRVFFEQYVGKMGLVKMIKLDLIKIKEVLPLQVFRLLSQASHINNSFKTLESLTKFLVSSIGAENTKSYLPALYEKITDFTPHVSLGYFAHTEGGKLAAECTEDWNRKFETNLLGHNITFQSYSLYGFMNMAVFLTNRKEA